MTEQQNPTPETPASAPPPDPAPPSRHRIAMAAALVAALGVGAGATAIAQKGRNVTLIALTPAPVSAMKDGEIVAVKGNVAETFGNKFVVQDPSGRALVETGRRGEDANLVGKDEPVTVQGRFEHGFIHAVAIQHADGHSDTLDPPPPPRFGGPGPGPDAPPPRPPGGPRP